MPNNHLTGKLPYKSCELRLTWALKSTGRAGIRAAGAEMPRL